MIVDKFAWDYSEDGLARPFYRSGLPRAFSTPKRWDVIVFRCPVVDVRCRACGVYSAGIRIDGEARCPVCGSTDVQIVKASEKDYIKRLVGLPGETIRIRHGDIVVNGSLAVRPPEVQNAQWQFVYDSAYVPKRPVPDVPAAWVAEEGVVKLDGAALRLTPGAGGKAEARYGRLITDASTYSGYDNTVPYSSFGERDAAYYSVGEIKCDVEVTLGGAGTLRLAIDEDESHYVGQVRFGDGAAKTSLSASSDGVASVESDFAAEPGRRYHVTFANASGRLELAVDGSMVLSCEHPMPKDAQAASSGLALSVESAEAEFSRVRLYRSIYYRPPDGGVYPLDASGRRAMTPESLIGANGYHLSEDQYLALGDNQPTSWDSRFWGMVPQRNLIGRGVVRWWPVRMLRPIY